MKRVPILVCLLSLGGCLLDSLPPAASIQLAPVPGAALPFKARVMIFASEADLAKTLTINLTRYQTEDSKIGEGAALAKAARTLLSKGFETVAVNDLSIRPQIVVKLIGNSTWTRQDGSMRLGCGLDAWTADGMALGTFTNRYQAERTDYSSELENGFAQCLKKPVDELLASPAVARLAGQGFRDPSPADASLWIKTLGPMPAF